MDAIDIASRIFSARQVVHKLLYITMRANINKLQQNTAHIQKKQHVENRWDCESLGPAVTVAANGQLAFFVVVVFAGIVNAVTETSY